jgi:hypothetical protein
MKTETKLTISHGELMSAESILKRLTDCMAADCKSNMNSWPREWMQKHITERSAIIKVRQILIDLAEAEAQKPCTDQGAGYWDCSRTQRCVDVQCEDCPQK